MTTSDSPTWNLYGTLESAAREPLAGVPVVVYPPASSYNDANTHVIDKVAADVSNEQGYFSIPVASVPGIVWLVGVGTDEPVTIPDPGPGASVNIDSLNPAYVPNWQGGKRVSQGAGIVSLRAEGSDLIATLNNGAVLPPVPFWSGETLDANDSSRAFLPLSSQHDQNAAMRVLVVGGGDGEGAGADVPADRWIDVMGDILRSAYGGVSGDQGVGYIPAVYADQSMNASPLQPALTGTVIPTNTSGLGNRSVQLGPDGSDSSSITWPAQKCNSITVHYATDANSKGSFQVWVDGTKQATLSSDPGSGDPNAAKTWTWTGTPANHTLRIIWDPTANSQPAVVQGAFFSTSTVGVKIYDGSRGGTTPQNLFEVAGDQSTKDLLAALQPHLVVLAFGRDEMATSTAAAWGASLRGTMAMIGNSAPGAGVLVVHDPMILSDANGATGALPNTVLTSFEDAARNVVADYPAASVLNLSRLWQPRPGSGSAAQDPWGWLDVDGDFSTQAHMLVGRYVARVFQKVLSGGAVTSVSGRTGNITLTASDITSTGGGFDPEVLAGGFPESGKYVDGSGQWTPLPAAGALTQQRGLIPMKEALEAGTVRIAVVGDGKAEGGGASDISLRWQRKISDALRDQMFASPNADQGAGYIPVWSTVLKSEATFGSGVVLSGAENSDYTLIGNAGGFGGRSAILQTVGTSATFPSSTVRYLTVCWTIDPANGGTFTVVVDGNLLATIDTTQQPTAAIGEVTTDLPNIGRQIIDLESIDTRQVVLASTGGTPTIEGILFATSNTGLTMVDASSSNFALVSDDFNAGSVDDLKTNKLANASLAQFDPHLVILATGTAEQEFADDTAWRTALGAYISTLTTVCPNAGVLLLHGAARPEDVRDPGIGLGRCGTYESSSQIITGQAQFATMVRESTLWQPNAKAVLNPENPTEQDPAGWLNGDFYPSDFGHARIAEHLVQTLIPGSGSATSANTLTVAMLDAALASDLSNVGSASRTLLDASYRRKDQRTGLIPWLAGYAARKASFTSIVVLSDFEGVGAATPVRDNKWQSLLRESLSGAATSGMIIPGYTAASGLTTEATYSPTSGASAPSVVVEGNGFGGRIIRIPSTGSVTLPAVTCTSFRLWYRIDSTHSGAADVAVDGTKVGSIAANGTANEIARWPVAGPQTVTAGSRVVKISATSGSFDLAAVEFFNGDETVGIHLYDHSRQGMQLADAVSSSSGGMWQMIAATSPALLVVMLGSHDLGGDTATFNSNLLALQQKISQYAPNSSVLLAVPPRPVVNGADPAQWDSFVNGMVTLAGLNPAKYAITNLQETWPLLQVGGATSLGLMVETDYPINYSPAGHQAVADALLRVLK